MSSRKHNPKRTGAGSFLVPEGGGQGLAGMVRQVGPSNAKWHVRAAGDFTMTSQRKSELEAVNRRLARNDPRLVELTLAWTACGDWGVEAISDVLKVNTVLVDLDLYHNDVGPRGASALARALRKNYTVNKINLDLNNIGDEGVQQFMDTLNGHNTSLTELKLSNNHVNPVQLRDLNVLLERNLKLKVDLDWHKVQAKILPLNYERGELETKKAYLQALKEADDPQVVEQIEDCDEEIYTIDSQVKELQKQEDKLLEDGTWLMRNFDRLRTVVKTYMGVTKVVNRLTAKKEQRGPTIEEERNENARQLSEAQNMFLKPEAAKWKPEYRKKMEDRVTELKLKQTEIRSRERSIVAKQQLEKQMRLQEAQKIREHLKMGNDDDMNRFKPKTVTGRFEVPADEKMPLTHKYTAFDRKLREAGVSIPKDEITYRPVRLDSQNLGRRFQEAYLDPQDRTVLGVRRKDRNPKNIYYKPNKYGADLVY